MTLMERRRGMMGAEQAEQGLPAEYQQVEWIGYDWPKKSYINNVMPYPNVETVVMDIEFTQKSTNNEAIVLSKAGPTFPVGVTNNSSKLSETQRGYDCSPVTSVSGSIPRNTYTFTKRQSAIITERFSLFGWNNSQWVAGVKAFGATMYNASNKLIFDGVPCYRKADTVIGIYDLVARQFFPASGTWTKGADVT